jgi:type I restriction enzyme M protein
MRFEEFAACQEWWGGTAREGRVESEVAWRVSIGELEADSFNLDRRNPNRPEDLAHRPPTELVAEMVENEREVMRLLEEIEAELVR